MGTTIENCINELLINKEDDTYVLGNETIDFAIDTMHKYQKIKEIMNELNGDFYGSYLKDRTALERVYEVIKNGNND